MNQVRTASPFLDWSVTTTAVPGRFMAVQRYWTNIRKCAGHAVRLHVLIRCWGRRQHHGSLAAPSSGRKRAWMADEYEYKEPEPYQPTLPSAAVAGKHIAAGAAIAIFGGWLMLAASGVMCDLVEQFVELFDMNMRENAPGVFLTFTVTVALVGSCVGLLVAVVRAQRNRSLKLNAAKYVGSQV
jgi:hypothetical protein